MKLKQLHEGKQYASVTDVLSTGTTLPASVMKQPTDNGYKAKATTATTPAPVTTVTGTTTAKQPKKLFKKEKTVVKVTTGTTGTITEAKKIQPANNYATRNDIEALAQFIAKQNSGQLTAEELEQLRSLIYAGTGTGQNTNPVTYEDPVLSGNGGTVVDTVETTDDDTDTEPSTGSGSENQTTAQKVIAWAKANALYLGIAAAVIIYIMYRRAQ